MEVRHRSQILKNVNLLKCGSKYHFFYVLNEVQKDLQDAGIGLKRKIIKCLTVFHTFMSNSARSTLTLPIMYPYVQLMINVKYNIYL